VIKAGGRDPTATHSISYLLSACRFSSFVVIVTESGRTANESINTIINLLGRDDSDNSLRILQPSWSLEIALRTKLLNFLMKIECRLRIHSFLINEN
jgi:hypothetical protein